MKAGGGYMVQVNNVSNEATASDVENFFTFCGRIEKVILTRDWTAQVAYVTFKDPESVDTAILLSGSAILNQRVNILPMDDADQAAVFKQENFRPVPTVSTTPGEVATKAQDMVKNMLAKGHILGKDVVAKAMAFDEKHGIRTKSSATVSSLSEKIALGERWNVGTTTVNRHVKEVNDKYQISEKTKSALTVAQQNIKTVGSSLATNKYVIAGGSWVSSAFDRVAKAAGDISIQGPRKAFT